MENMTSELEKKTMDDPLDPDWLELFYARVTSLYILSRQSLHNTHQWAISLAIALITAVFAIGETSSGFPNQTSFIVLIVSFPLLLRFFIRSCLECSIQHKFQKIRDELDKYMMNGDKVTEKDNNHLKKVIDSYYFKFLSPKSINSIVKENLKLAYKWVFMFYIFLIIWSAFKIQYSPLIIILSISALIFTFYEIISFIHYPKLKQVDIED